MRTSTELPPSFAAATAWLAPFPPGNIWKLPPSTVSPGAGRCSTRTTKSMLRLPTTTIAGFIAPALSGEIDPQLLELFGVIAPVQQVPLLAAFGDLALLRPNLLARQAVDLILRAEQFGHGAHDLEPHFVGVLLDTQLARFPQRRHDLVRHVCDLVARELHLVARIASRRANYLALRHQGVLDLAEHLLVTDALAPHVVTVLLEDLADFLVQPVFDGQLFVDDAVDDLDRRLRIRRFQNLRRKLSNDLAREIADEFSG